MNSFETQHTTFCRVDGLNRILGNLLKTVNNTLRKSSDGLMRITHHQKRETEGLRHGETTNTIACNAISIQEEEGLSILRGTLRNLFLSISLQYIQDKQGCNEAYHEHSY